MSDYFLARKSMRFSGSARGSWKLPCSEATDLRTFGLDAWCVIAAKTFAPGFMLNELRVVPLGELTLLDKWSTLEEASRDENVSPRAFMLFFRLLFHHNMGSGGCYPSQNTLAKAMHCSTVTVRNAKRELLECNYILSSKRSGKIASLQYDLNIRKHKNSFGRSNKFDRSDRKKTFDNTKKEYIETNNQNSRPQTRAFESIETRFNNVSEQFSKSQVAECNRGIVNCAEKEKEGWRLLKESKQQLDEIYSKMIYEKMSPSEAFSILENNLLA